MQVRWVHYPDVVEKEVTTVVKVVRKGGLNTRVILSNGRNDLVPAQYDPPIAVGDKVVLCPPTREFQDSSQDAVLVSLRRKRKEGKLPDHVVEALNKSKMELGKFNSRACPIFCVNEKIIRTEPVHSRIQ